MAERQFLLADRDGVFCAEIDEGVGLHVRTIDRRGSTDRWYDADQAGQLAEGLAGLVEQMKAGAAS